MPNKNVNFDIKITPVSKEEIKVKRKVLFIGTLIMVFIVSTPILFDLYQLFPDVPIWETQLGTYNSNYYESINVLAWTIVGKLIPLSLILIWFLTCKHWWYHALIVPLSMYAYQIFAIFNDDNAFVEVNNILVFLPIIMVIAVFSYALRTRIFDKIYGIEYVEMGRGDLKGNMNTKADPESFNQKNNSSQEDDENEDDDEEPTFMSFGK